MNDPVLEGWLTKQLADGMALAASSDILDLKPEEGPAPTCYLARYRARGLVKEGPGEPEVADDFLVGIRFDRDYLRYANPAHVLSWLAPHSIFHPNICMPVVCLGPIAAGTQLVELLYRMCDLITFRNVTPREDDALNAVACSWARNNRHRFPIDRRPLKRIET